MRVNPRFKQPQFVQTVAGTSGILGTSMVLPLMDIQDISVAWLARLAYRGMLRLLE